MFIDLKSEIIIKNYKIIYRKNDFKIKNKYKTLITI